VLTAKRVTKNFRLSASIATTKREVPGIHLGGAPGTSLKGPEKEIGKYVS